MNRRGVTIGGILLLSVGVGAFFVSAPQPLQNESTPSVSLSDGSMNPGSDNEFPENEGSAHSTASKGSITREPSSVAPLGAAPAERSPAGPLYGRDLADYAKLKSKVFLNDDDKREKSRLLQDAALMRSLEPLLKKPIVQIGPEQEEQNAAIDFLLEAAMNSSPAAVDVLRSVIEDRQVENARIDMKSREALAGVKAEILYHWSSADPARSQQFTGWLPGPVSQKIWENVRDRQERNRAESASELAQ
jgi:hypothetical protein